MSSPMSSIRRRGLNLLRTYRDADETQRTPILRDLAEALVEARQHFQTDEAEPDWRGRTHAYREWVRDLYEDADYGREERGNVQAAVRYHVGAVLRDRLSDEEREDAGLIPESPRQRSRDRRETRNAVVQLALGRDAAGGALYGIVAANTVLGRIDPGEIDTLDAHAAALAAGTLRDLERTVRRLRRVLAAREPG